MQKVVHVFIHPLEISPEKSNIHIQIKINVTFLISIPHNFSFFIHQREEDIA